MQTLCVVGEGSLSVCSRLAERVAESHEGRVATVDYTAEVDFETLEVPTDVEGDAGNDDSSGVDGVFSVDNAGRWTGTGTGRSVVDLLDSLATDYEYAFVAGLTHHRLPSVVIGDVETPPSAEIIATAPTAAELDIETIVDRVDSLRPHITLETLIELAKASPQAERSGAIATFTGRVRAKDGPEDARTEHLAFETYEEVAEARLSTITQELTDRDGVFEVLLHHRVGLMADGEDIVFVVVLAGHREEAFRAVEDGINRLKDEVPIFKKETTTDEEFWLHELDE